MIIRIIRIFGDEHDPSAPANPVHPVKTIFRIPEKLPVFDLQRFAAEDEGRTEDPTERRQREERDKGNVPKSQDVASASVLIGTVLALFFSAAYMFHQTRNVFTKFLGGEYGTFYDLQTSDVRMMILGLFWETAKIVGPVMITALIMAIVGNVSQIGLLFTTEPLQFRPERLIPDFKRILPVRRTMYNLLKILVQTIIIAAIAYFLVMDDFIPMLKSAGMGLEQAVALFGIVSFKLLIVCAVVSLALAIPDYFYQRFEYMENLKMTVSESKRERREMEGDPLVRQRQRERGYELRRQSNMLKEVPRADVVITNPTHFAVALLFKPEVDPAPVVTAKGSDSLALKIRLIARENGVPIQESPALARQLYSEVEVGQTIPATLYQVISQIFSRLAKFKKGV